MSPFRLVSFDVTNTLLHFRVPVGAVYSDAANLYNKNVQLDKNKVNENFRKGFKDMCIKHPNFGVHSGVSSKKWWSILAQRTLRDSSAPGDFSEGQLLDISKHLYDLYQTDECWEVLPGAGKLLDEIKSKGLKLCVISNFDDRLDDVLRSNRVLSYFDFVLNSRDVKVTKPDKRIYELAMSSSGEESLKPEECVHVGDDLVNDYLGAKGAGWNALLLAKDSSGQASQQDLVQTAEDIHKKIFLN